MFEVNDYIICGGNGVCEVLDIGTPSMSTGNEKKQYYKLRPIYENGSTVYTPVDNDRVVMRKILSKEEADVLINNIPSIEILKFEDDKMYQGKYKEVMHKYDCTEWIKIIKTLYLRNEERLKEGKKSTSTDDKYLKMAEEYLFGELAVSLSMDREEVKPYIMKKIDKIKKSEV